MSYIGQPERSAPRDADHSLSGALDQMMPVIERLGAASAELHTIVDRIAGSRPEPAPTGTRGGREVAEPSSLIGSIHHRRELLVEIANRFEDTLRRLSGAV